MTTDTTRPRAFIFHGYGASPADHWFGWLAEKLAAASIPTMVPELPAPLAPKPDRWAKAIGEFLEQPDESTTVIGHSLGCLAVVRHLQSLRGPWRLGTLVLVSGFTETLPALPELDDFIGDGCDVSGLPTHIGRLIVIRSDNDPLVPPTHTDRLAQRLGVTARVVPGAGHFLADEGFVELPAVFDALALASRPRAPGAIAGA